MQSQRKSSTTLVFMAVVAIATGCSLIFWEHWSMERIMYHQDIVVFGKETERINTTDAEGQLMQQDAIFEVFCVLKNKNPAIPIPKTFTISEVYPINSCSGTSSKYKLNQEVLLGVRRRIDGKLVWHEPNPTPDGAVFNANRTNLERAGRVCGMNVMKPPAGVTGNRCPKKVAEKLCVTGSAAGLHSVMGVLAILPLVFALLLTV